MSIINNILDIFLGEDEKSNNVQFIHLENWVNDFIQSTMSKIPNTNLAFYLLIKQNKEKKNVYIKLSAFFQVGAEEYKERTTEKTVMNLIGVPRAYKAELDAKGEVGITLHPPLRVSQTAVNPTLKFSEIETYINSFTQRLKTKEKGIDIEKGEIILTLTDEVFKKRLEILFTNKNLKVEEEHLFTDITEIPQNFQASIQKNRYLKFAPKL